MRANRIRVTPEELESLHAKLVGFAAKLEPAEAEALMLVLSKAALVNQNLEGIDIPVPNTLRAEEASSEPSPAVSLLARAIDGTSEVDALAAWTFTFWSYTF